MKRRDRSVKIGFTHKKRGTLEAQHMNNQSGTCHANPLPPKHENVHTNPSYFLYTLQAKRLKRGTSTISNAFLVTCSKTILKDQTRNGCTGYRNSQQSNIPYGTC